MFPKRWRNREIVKAVHDNDLEDLLASLGCLELIKDGRATCKFCNKIITVDNLQAIIPDQDTIAFCCNDLTCVQGL